MRSLALIAVRELAKAPLENRSRSVERGDLARGDGAPWLLSPS